MKFSLLLTLSLFSLSFSAAAQQQFEIFSERPGEITWKGILSRDLIEKDTTQNWYAQNKKGYTPNSKALNGLKAHADSIQLVTFMGTWCEDSHFIIPKFFTLLDAAEFPRDHVTLIGVDRDKKTISHLSEALAVKNIPTIIVMKNGKEVGRVVEFGKYGLYDMELGEILTALNP